MLRRMSASDTEEDRAYRNLIDRLVHDCREGQGQVGPTRGLALYDWPRRLSGTTNNNTARPRQLRKPSRPTYQGWPFAFAIWMHP